jgi:hypothetical protein
MARGHEVITERKRWFFLRAEAQTRPAGVATTGERLSHSTNNEFTRRVSRPPPSFLWPGAHRARLPARAPPPPPAPSVPPPPSPLSAAAAALAGARSAATLSTSASSRSARNSSMRPVLTRSRSASAHRRRCSRSRRTTSSALRKVGSGGRGETRLASRARRGEVQRAGARAARRAASKASRRGARRAVRKGDARHSAWRARDALSMRPNKKPTGSGGAPRRPARPSRARAPSAARAGASARTRAAAPRRCAAPRPARCVRRPRSRYLRQAAERRRPRSFLRGPPLAPVTFAPRLSLRVSPCEATLLDFIEKSAQRYHETDSPAASTTGRRALAAAAASPRDGLARREHKWPSCACRRCSVTTRRTRPPRAQLAPHRPCR